MTPAVQNALSLIGRTLLAVMFVIAGSTKIGGFDNTVAYVASHGMPLAQLVAVLTIALELVGGLAVVVGLYARWAALALAAFTLLASLLFHNFWAMPVEEQATQYLMFMKNIAITGGLLAIAAFGAGRFSLDARRGAA